MTVTSQAPRAHSTSLEEIHSSVPIPRIWWQRILAFSGAAFLISVGYMDPGNWGTNLAAGGGFGYELLWVILVSNAIAILLQISSAKLGIATGKNLAQLIREQFPRSVVAFLGVTTAVAMMATDLAEVLGGALGFNILFHIPQSRGVPRPREYPKSAACRKYRVHTQG